MISTKISKVWFLGGLIFFNSGGGVEVGGWTPSGHYALCVGKRKI